MKIRKLLLSILLTLPLVSGCSNKTPINNEDVPIIPVDSPWSEQQLELFNKYLYGFALPYKDGIEVRYDLTNKCLVLKKQTIEEDEFNNYVNSIVNLGFSKKDGPYVNTYILKKDLVIEGKNKTINVDIYIENGGMVAVCYDPYLYSWPKDEIASFISTNCKKTPNVPIPLITTDRYLLDTSRVNKSHILIIKCESNKNIELDYKAALKKAGYFAYDEKNLNGYYYANDVKNYVEIFYMYSSQDNCLEILIKPYGGWPSTEVDYYTNQFTNNSGTIVPSFEGATSYEFIESSYDSHGYFFVLCETNKNPECAYASLLDEDYTVYNEKTNSAGNYYAVSDKEDLLVQYKYVVNESIMGSASYTHFDVMFEKYYPHNEEHISQGLALIAPDSKTSIPAYPGHGEKITISDNDIYMTITVQAATFDSVSTYVETLTNAKWNVKEINKMTYSYQAVSPTRDLKLETSMLDGRVTLQFSSYEDPYKEWPSDGVNEIMDELNLTGEVPSFEGALGFDYEIEEYYQDVVCFVETGKEAELISAYNQKLINLGWKTTKINGYTYYIHDSYTVALRAYAEYEGCGIVFIDFKHC